MKQAIEHVTDPVAPRAPRRVRGARRGGAFLVAALCLLAIAGGGRRGVCDAPPPADEQDLIQINLPPTVELGVLIEYVSKRLNMNIVYNEALGKTRVSIVSPAKIHKDALLGMLESILKSASLNILDTDQPGLKAIGRRASVQLVRVQHVSADQLAAQVTNTLKELARITEVDVTSSGPAAGVRVPVRRTAASAPPPQAALVPDTRTNQIAIVGTAERVAEAMKLVRALDIAADVATRKYTFRTIDPSRIDKLVRDGLAGTEPKPPYASAADEPSGLLVVTTTAKLHAYIQSLSETLDVEPAAKSSFVQSYKLVNTKAADVLETIQNLYGSAGGKAREDKDDFRERRDRQPARNVALNAAATPPGSQPAASDETPLAAAALPRLETGLSTSEMATLARDASVAADENTNSIIVIAPADVQELYAKLIDMLDERRPQVLVEVTLVALDTSDNYAVGVEFAWREIGMREVLMFSSFGLSTLDLASAIPALEPGSGFNGILLDPETVNLVVRALATDSRSRVLAAPKVLVNDHTEATLTSIAEEPFTSVNASETVATTSFAGYAEAGTSVTVTPHISTGDYLQLEYSITLNSFTGEGAEGIPPPRKTDEISSQITIPNGHAVVVGGLKRRDLVKAATKVPILGDLPLLKYIFSARTKSDSESTFFVFIRPVILRDDRFLDLKYLSGQDLEAAKLPSGFPESEPLLIVP